jgi:AAA domain (dynein-related subfamily)
MKHFEVTPSQLLPILRDCHAAKLNPFVQGQPGVGKSAIVAQYAAEIGAEFIDARLAYYAPQDVQGFPYLDTDEQGVRTMRLSRPAFWPKSENPVIALEEFNCATRSVQNVALQLLNDRRVGDHRLPDNAFVALLGNRPEDRVHIEKLSSAVVNRIVNIRVQLSLPDWVSWAQGNGVDPLVVAFLNFRPDLLTTFDGAKWDGISNFATPRTWEKASDIVKTSSDAKVRHALLEGVLGQGAAAEFIAFLGIFEKLPDLDGILKNPEKGKVPTDPATLYATCAGLAKKVKAATFQNFITYLGRMPKEFCVFAMKTAISSDQSLARTPAFGKWATANREIFS